ncbi:MAG: ATP-binding cassette domain-containing protein [Lachnospiraceae bacterium]|nr:ATP-binding cassette domain-containing protein [Lachnospiraceae bacterium]
MFTVTLEHIDKWYHNPRSKDAVHALKDVNLELTEGIYGLVGRNGAGKSTLIQILVGNLPQTSGRILVNGEPVRTDGKAYKRLIGYMPQQQWIYEGMTCVQFLNYMYTLKGVAKKERKECAAEQLERVHLWEKRHHKIGALSGGMKQRLLFAQAIGGNPMLLVLDEPTAGVDPQERETLQELIVANSKGRIVLLSTHILSDIEGIAKKTITMEAGSPV